MNYDHLASVAAQWVRRVHEHSPHDNAAWLAANTTAEEREALLYVLPVWVAPRPLGALLKELRDYVDPTPDPDYVDEVAVERACDGDPVSLTWAEQKVVIARLTGAGVSSREVARRVGLAQRTVERYRARWRERVA